MNSLSSLRSPLGALTALLAFGLGFQAQAQSVTTTPVGAMNYTISAGSLTSPVTTLLAIPMTDIVSVPSGLTSGIITSFTSNSFTNPNGGWSSSLATAGSSPWMVKIVSGTAAGTLLSVVSNTSTTVTVSGADLSVLGVIAGQDKFEFIAVDTLFSLFGSDSLLGGPNWTSADNVYIMSSGTFIGYFYDTTLGYWRRVNSGSTTNRNDIIIRPDTGVLIARRGEALNLTFTGRVPTTSYRAPISNAGTTTIHTGFPVAVTLNGLALNTNISGWRTSTNWALADQVYVFSAGSWTGFYHNGTVWRRANSGSTLDRGGIEIEAGAPIQIFRPTGLAAGETNLVRALPYTL
jgi:hypothetical protein